MNRNELIAEISALTGSTKKSVSEIVDVYEKVICDTIRKNEAVALHGFLKIEKRKRKGHKGLSLIHI